MRLQPKRSKYRKQQKGSRKGVTSNERSLGTVGLRAIERGRLNARQLEAARRTIRHHLNREGQLQMKVFPDIPVTAKPLEVRMGKGKGAISQYGTKVQPGKLLFEVGGVPNSVAEKALLHGGKKLAVKTNRKYRFK